MKKLIDFNDFMFNKLMEEMSANVKVNELELILSARLKNILKEINHKVAHDLLALHKDSKREYKKTFIDLGSKPDLVSFIQSNKVPELIEPEIVHGTFQRNPNFKLPPNWAKQPDERTEDEKSMGEFDIIDGMDWKNPWIQDINHILDLHEIQFTDKNHPVWTKNRAEVKIGRFINQMFPDKYPASVKREDRPKVPNDVETFVNMFVATVESKSKMIVQVNGEKIREYYDCKNYFKDQGTLGGSCMKDSSKMNQLDIYVENPEKVSMLALYPEDIRDKIIGRAILWKLDKVDGEKVKDKYFMDRVYTASDSDEFMYIEYAKANGYYYKSVQTYGAGYDIIHPDGTIEKTELEVELKPKSYGRSYPYMDTMQFYNPETGWICNIESRYRNDNYGILTDYTGPISFY